MEVVWQLLLPFTKHGWRNKCPTWKVAEVAALWSNRKKLDSGDFGYASDFTGDAYPSFHGARYS